MAVEGGTYVADETLLNDARRGANGVTHPAQLGSLMAKHFADAAGCPCYVVNPPDTDELQAVARITGVSGVYRNVHLHALNLKETAIRHAASLGGKYEDYNFVVCHLGGGVSVSAHRRGKMVDGYDIVGGEGPMAPTRCGAVPVSEIAAWLDKGHTTKELRGLCHKGGGFVSHLGTSDAQEVQKMAAEGDEHADLVWNAFVYQVEKGIAATSTPSCWAAASRTPTSSWTRSATPAAGLRRSQRTRASSRWRPWRRAPRASCPAPRRPSTTLASRPSRATPGTSRTVGLARIFFRASHGCRGARPVAAAVPDRWLPRCPTASRCGARLLPHMYSYRYAFARLVRLA